MVKDYYKILELPPNAGLPEIKKNFRRLALRYHPDTNPGNDLAEAWYREIKEAYETLTDADLREAYLQERWLAKSQNKPFATSAAVTPAIVLVQLQDLLRQVKTMDRFRMSHPSLQQVVLDILSADKILMLKKWNDEQVNSQVVALTLAVLDPLDFPYLQPVIDKLNELAANDAALLQQVDRFMSERKQANYWERYQGVAVLVITFVVCLVIYLLSL